MIRIFFAAGLCLCLTSCAVVFQGSKKVVYIKSQTPDSRIYVDGAERGKDSVVIALRRKHNHIVMVEKPGYDTATVTIKKHLQLGWVAADVASLAVKNVLALPLDFITGAWFTFDKKNINVSLKSTATNDTINTH